MSVISEPRWVNPKEESYVRHPLSEAWPDMPDDQYGELLESLEGSSGISGHASLNGWRT